jgi:hypothetical protein
MKWSGLRGAMVKVMDAFMKLESAGYLGLTIEGSYVNWYIRQESKKLSQFGKLGVDVQEYRIGGP